MNKVLIITYYWPPSGGAGVQRWLKFSKYLPELGWEPVILTVDPDYAAYPVTDYSLTADLPSSTRVHKTAATNYFSVYNKDKSKIPTAGFANSVNNTLKGKIMRFIRGNFFIPDPRRGWNKYAFNKACSLIETEAIEHVITSSPPHSTQLIGLKLKKRYPGIKWVADLRDPWTDIYYYKQFYPTCISKAIDSAFEKSVLKNADRIITVGPSLKTLYSQKVIGIAGKTEVITNGYDEVDFADSSASSNAIFTISYIGTLSEAYPINGFLHSLRNSKLTDKPLILRFIGTVSLKQKELILSKTKDLNVEFISYVDHTAAVQYMLDTSVLLLIIPDHQSNRSIITGKIFEYIAAEKPVICLGPVDGDASEILKESGHGVTFEYNDSKGISEYLERGIYDNPISGKTSPKAYSRNELARKVVSILEAI